MVTSLLLPFVVGQTPKTFEELELLKLKTYHSIGLLKEDLTVTIASGGQDSMIHRVTEKDGVKIHSALEAGATRFETFSTATTSYLVFHTVKKYATTKIDATGMYDARGDLLKAEKESLNFRCDTSTPVRFAIDPPFQIKSVEQVKDGGRTLRKITATTKNSKGRSIHLVQFFKSDDWLLVKFALDGESESGKISIKGECKVLDVKPTFAPNTFVFDAKKYPGYALVDMKELGG